MFDCVLEFQYKRKSDYTFFFHFIWLENFKRSGFCSWAQSNIVKMSHNLHMSWTKCEKITVSLIVKRRRGTTIAFNWNKEKLSVLHFGCHFMVKFTFFFLSPSIWVVFFYCLFSFFITEKKPSMFCGLEILWNERKKCGKKYDIFAIARE